MESPEERRAYAYAGDCIVSQETVPYTWGSDKDTAIVCQWTVLTCAKTRNRSSTRWVTTALALFKTFGVKPRYSSQSTILDLRERRLPGVVFTSLNEMKNSPGISTGGRKIATTPPQAVPYPLLETIIAVNADNTGRSKSPD